MDSESVYLIGLTAASSWRKFEAGRSRDKLDVQELKRSNSIVLSRDVEIRMCTWCLICTMFFSKLYFNSQNYIITRISKNSNLESKIQLGEGGRYKNSGAFTLAYFRNESYFSKCLF